MQAIREKIKTELAEILTAFLREKTPDAAVTTAGDVLLEVPPDPNLGDYAFPCFPLAKTLRMGPPMISGELAKRIASAPGPRAWTAEAAGPYVNIRLKRVDMVRSLLESDIGESWGTNGSLSGRRVMLEFSCPNTNKPLHLGHLRNNALGESVSRLLKASGAEVRKVNLINDRGVHICRSMLSYMKYGQGKTPESEGVKGDHFVGAYYVDFNRLKEEDPKADEKAQELLLLWESGDGPTIDLWKRMNSWTISGMEETYRRTGISFDTVYRESQTYRKGKDEVLRGLAEGVFFKADDGSIRIDLADIGLDTKVLLRGDGTSIYITQDIGTAIDRHKDWPFDRLVYVVACEQQYHFKVLFHILKKLGYDFADQLYHLSYGLVNLPEGRMKTREGTVVDADDLIDQLRDLALEEISAKGREDDVGVPEEVAEKIALGALHYFLLQATPAKDMIFNPKESLAFNGDTGPYIQYMGARIESILRKAKDKSLGKIDAGLLANESEWELTKLVASFPETVAQAAADMNPALVAARLYALASAFSRFYHDCPILNNDDVNLAATRLELSKKVLATLKAGMRICLIPYLETM